MRLRVVGNTDDVGEITDSLIQINHGSGLYPLGDLEKLTIPTPDGTGEAVHPNVVFIPGGFGGYMWWMVITPYYNNNSALENPCILASNDGETFIVPTGLTNPLVSAPAEGFYADPNLVWNQEDEELYCYWTHYGASDGSHMYRLTSTDGVTWGDLTECTPNIPACNIVRLASDEWVSFNRSEADTLMLTRSFSTDGINFGGEYKVTTNLKGKPIHMTLYYDGSGFHFLVAILPLGLTATVASSTFANIHYGYSENGTNLIFDPAPLFQTDITKWCNNYLYTSCMCPDGEQKINVYISGHGNPDSPEWGVGLLKCVQGSITQRMTPYGSKAGQKQEIVLYDALEIRDTQDYYYKSATPGTGGGKHIADYNNYTKRVLTITNTLKDSNDDGVSVVLRVATMFNGGSKTLNMGSSRTAQQVTVSYSANPVLITSEDVKSLDELFAGKITFIATASAIPVSGSFTAVLDMIC